MLKVIALTSILAAAPIAFGASLDIGFGIPHATTHSAGKCLDERYYCNENNHILMATYVTDSRWGFTATRFVNSHYNPTTAVALSYTFRQELFFLDALELRPIAGFMKGYTRDQVPFSEFCPSENVCPMAALSTTLMVTDWLGITTIHFGANVQTWALRLRFEM